jgi:hypothetical protein
LIDIHQHLNFWGRSNEDFIQHQKDLGALLTVLLPSDGYNDLTAKVTGPEEAYQFCRKHEGFLFAANAPNWKEDMQDIVAGYLDKGAKLIGEIKFDSPGDSSDLWAYAEVAQQYKVPILIHFQHCKGTRLKGFEKTLQRFPDVNFIGHATQWWNERDGITNKLMKKYPNLYGDISAGSGYAALTKDGAAKFLYKYQDRLLFGSDCNCSKFKPFWHGNNHIRPLPCSGCNIVNNVKKLTNKTVIKKILYKNTEKLLGVRMEPDTKVGRFKYRKRIKKNKTLIQKFKGKLLK